MSCITSADPLAVASTRRRFSVWLLFKVCCMVLIAKLFLAVLWEYRWYFQLTLSRHFYRDGDTASKDFIQSPSMFISSLVPSHGYAAPSLL